MITGILLAGGRAQRFGSDKLRARLPDGRCVAEAAAAAMVDALPRVLAVVRPGCGPLGAILQAAGCELVRCPHADQGMGASLACGVGAAPDADGWVVALADMPWIRPATIGRVAAGLIDGVRIIAPVDAGRRGHPVGFAGDLGADLAALTGDRGARDLIAAHDRDVVLFESGDPGVLHDIDTPEDLPRRGFAPNRPAGPDR